jgi:hypothetical protein
MRIHDIAVVADPNRRLHDEPEPEVVDGTATGFKPCAAATNFMNLLLEAVFTNTLSWWTGWWPVLHVRTNGTLDSGGTYAYQRAIDILGASWLEEIVMNTPLDDHLSDQELEAMSYDTWEEFYGAAFPLESILLVAAESVGVLMDILLFFITKIPTPAQLIAYSVLLATWVTLMIGALGAIWDGVITRRLNLGPAFGLLVSLAIVAGLELALPYLTLINWLQMNWYKRYLNNSGPRVWAMAVISIFNLYVRALLVGVMISMAIRIREMQAQEML